MIKFSIEKRSLISFQFRHKSFTLVIVRYWARCLGQYRFADHLAGNRRNVNNPKGRRDQSFLKISNSQMTGTYLIAEGFSSN